VLHVSSRPVFVRAPSGGDQCQYDELRRRVGVTAKLAFISLNLELKPK